MNARDVLVHGQDYLLRHLKELPEQHWESPGVCGWWSTREILAHLASFEQVLVEVLEGFLAAGGVEREQPYLKQWLGLGGLGFNDYQVDIRKDRAPVELLAELEQAHAAGLALIEQIDAETIRRPGTLPWYGDEYALDDLIVYQFYGNKREHTGQVNAFRHRLRTEGE